jgi:16S rRNA processing protein RimM
MGRVAGSYGVRGWMKVVPGGGVLETLARTKEWWIGERAYRVAEAKVHSATVVAKLDGIESREQALALKGLEVLVRREALPEAEEGHYYLADLIGLEVRSLNGEALGQVKRFFTNGAQDVMEVAAHGPKGRTHLIPWVSAIVKQVDLEGRSIVVEWNAQW